MTLPGGRDDAAGPAGDTGGPAPIDLRPLFAPASIAVVGASPRSGIATTIRDNVAVMGGAARVHFVNPRHASIDGTPCVPSLADLPEQPESVVVAVHPSRAAEVAREAVDAGARALVIPGGGAVEGGPAALAMQDAVRALALEHRVALLGPNCMGVVDWTTRSATYIGDVNPWLPAGGVAAIAQSGSVSDAFIHAGTRIGFSRVVSCGTEAMLDVCDYLAWSLDDPATHTIALFIEGFKRPERFLALADRALAIGVPILAVVVGRSRHAQAAAIAHTGTLAGEARATEAALEAAGVVRCADLDELLETAELFAGCRRLGRSVGRGRTGVVTVSTGEASLIADLAGDIGLDLPPVPPAARDAILADLPTMGFVANPLDPWGADEAPRAYDAAFRAFAASGAYDVLAIVHDFPFRSLPGEVAVAREVTAPLLAATRDRPDLLPVYVSLTAGDPTPEVQALLDGAGGVPLLRGASEALAALVHRRTWEASAAGRALGGPRRPAWPALATRVPSRGDDPTGGPASAPVDVEVLGEAASLGRLAALGLPTVALRVVDDADGAVAAWRAFAGPVAVKVAASGVAHKSDVGGVRHGLDDPAAVREAAESLLEVGRRVDPGARLVVQPMAPPGVELIVGGRRDPVVGPVVLVGLGGIDAEATDDVVLLLAPLDEAVALEGLGRLRGIARLRGSRGRPAVDLRAVARLLADVGRCLGDDLGIVELDLNPVIASPGGVLAVDALVVLDPVARG